MTIVTKEQAMAEVEKRAKNVTEDDLRIILDKKDEIEKKFKENGPLGRFVADLKLLFSIVKDYIGGEYKEIPFLSIAAIVAALLYVLSPVDLIPDAIPVIGFVDDGMVIGVCLRMIEKDLHKYRDWKIAHA